MDRNQGVSRRVILRGSLLGLGVACVPLLQACGGGAAPTSAATQPAASTGGAAHTAATPSAAAAAPTAAKPAAPTGAATVAAAPTAAAQAAPQTSGVVLQALWVNQTALLKYFQNFADKQFAPAHNGTSVKFEVAPDLLQKLLPSIAAGRPPDFFRAVNVEIFAQVAANNIIVDLGDLIKRDNYQSYLDTFLPGSLDTGKYHGKQFGIPIGAHPSSYFLFYNKTAVEKKGFKLNNLSWKWADYENVAKEMTDAKNQVFGAWIRTNLEGYLVGVRSMGGDILDKTGMKSQIASEPAKRFWNHVYAMIVAAKAAPKPADMANWMQPFADGKVMMANDNGYRESFLRGTVKSFTFDTFVIPNEGALPPGALIVDMSPISQASKNRDLAWEWYKSILTTAEGVRRVQVAQYIPLPTKEALLAKDAMVSPQYAFYVNQWIAHPPLPAPVPANGRATEFYNALQKDFDPAWLGTKPLDQVISDVDKEVQSILDKPQV